MGQLALISDIHGNLPALLAVLNDIDNRRINRIICLGDVIGKGPNNCEALDICRCRCETIIKGNWEEYVANFTPKESAIWVQAQIGEERLKYIRSINMTKEMWISGKFMRLFHSHPNDFTRVFTHGTLEEKKLLFIDNITGKVSDIAGYGDIHTPYMQMVEGKMLFNVGSVGNPLDMPLCSYVILTGELDSKIPSGYSIEFVRVPYNIENAVCDAYKIKDLPCLDAYINELKTCKYNRR